MIERILIEKGWLYRYSFKENNNPLDYYCNKEEWKLYEIKWKMFKNGVSKEDIDELEDRVKDVVL